MASAQEIGAVHGTRQWCPMVVLGQCVWQKDQPEASLMLHWWRTGGLRVRMALALNWGTPACEDR